MSLTHVPVAPVPPERFMEILGPQQADEFRDTIRRGLELLDSRVIWNVNSTAQGGGVAEMLASLLAYTRGAGLDARWVVTGGDPSFYRVTKRIHNMLHGFPGDGRGLDEKDLDVYDRTTEENARELVPLISPGDIVLLHDPQTAGLIGPVRDAGAHVVWRCHIGVDTANDHGRAAWDFLLPHVRGAEALVFTREAHIWDGLDRSRVTLIPPSIDAFSAKNQEMRDAVVNAILCKARLQPGHPAEPPVFVRRDGSPGRVDRPATRAGSHPLPAGVQALIQVSRWDRLKDPEGVLEAFASHVAPRSDAHLVLAGPSTEAVADDPEGAEVLSEVGRLRASLPRSVGDRVHLFSLPMEDVAENGAIVNAIQRRADVIAQKSVAEGFGLTVAEAMWKARPVVAGAVGGIREQVIDGETGFLVDPLDLEAFAAAALELLGDPERAIAMGARAREEVRERYLGPRHLRQYVELFERLLGAGAGEP
ncbi:MAG: glycosyltransferase [Thermoleophilaceae bacterium]|nr:glycosyltransferase [Thermoleophilaceae bacterium]